MVFIDLEKVCSRVPRCGGLYIYRGVTRKQIKVKDMYGDIISVRRNGNFPNEFLSQQVRRQGLALSSYLFALVMDEHTRLIRDEVHWCMLFADDIMLFDEPRRGVDATLSQIGNLEG